MRTLALISSIATCFMACASPEPDDDEIDDVNWGGKGDGAISEDDFWADGGFYYVHITGWDPNRMTPARLQEEATVSGAKVSVYRSKYASQQHCPSSEVGASDLIYSTQKFSLRTSGNLTNGTPKSSYKIAMTDKLERMYAMGSLNLKSMWNDVSQMREALAWSLMRKAGIAASRHTYAKLCINDKYYGLYSIIEQVDKALLKDHFGKENDDGNLYKAYWADIGPATLEYRKSSTGDDSGKQYFTKPSIDDRTYQLKTNEDSDDDPALQSYDDLAGLIRAINGVGLPGGDDKFATAAYKAQLEATFNVKAFLRWASVNMLIGAWDNYWKTPANYYVYDSGKRDVADGFMTKPYFTWIPWDYDNSFGIDFFNTPWADKNIVNWESAGSKLPLIRNVLRNPDYLRYYLDHMEYLLDCCVNEAWITKRIGPEASSTVGIWERVRHAAFLEADQPTSAPHTGRQFTNDQVYKNGFLHQELVSGTNQRTTGILHFIRMRQTSVRAQLSTLRQTHPKGSSGATFPATMEQLPAP